MSPIALSTLASRRHGAVGGAAVNGVIGGVQGVLGRVHDVLGGVHSGLRSGSRSIPAAAVAVAAVGAAGLVEWAGVIARRRNGAGCALSDATIPWRAQACVDLGRRLTVGSQEPPLWFAEIYAHTAARSRPACSARH